MTTTRVPYGDATPAQLREAIAPERQADFDTSFQRALTATARTLSPRPLEEFLAHWRRLAWAQNHDGHDAWRLAMARADYTLATGGQRPPVDATITQIRRLLAERQRAPAGG